MNCTIFRTTSQALHFAFLIEAYEISAESPLSKAIRIRELEEGGLNVPQSSINFSGHSALEIRAQCAMIRAIVVDRLPGPERWAIQARYGINQLIMEDGTRRPIFSRTRYDAIMQLSTWMSTSMPELNPLAVDLLVARAVDKRMADASFRSMADAFGASKTTWHRSLTKVRKRVQALEDLAIDRLTPSFIADDLVEPAASARQASIQGGAHGARLGRAG